MFTFEDLRQDNLNGPGGRTMDEIRRGEDSIVSEEICSKNQDILCNALVQQHTVRARKKAQAMDKGNAIFKTKNYNVRAIIDDDSVRKTVTTIVNTRESPILVKADCLTQAKAEDAVTE